MAATGAAVAVVLPGSQSLSERQLKILQWVADGKKNTEIAELMSLPDRTITPNAVQMQVNVILDAIGTSSRSAAVAWAMRRGLVK